MSAIQRFFDWWQKLPETQSALYPEPDADPKLKEYGVFLDELDKRWPTIREAIFDALGEDEYQLMRKSEEVADEVLAWWTKVEKRFVKYAYAALKRARLHPEVLTRHAFIGFGPDNKPRTLSVGIGKDRIKLFVEVDRGEVLFEAGGPLREAIDDWLKRCRARLEEFRRAPLGKPLVAYVGHDGGAELPEQRVRSSMTTGPLEGVPIGGPFYAGGTSPVFPKDGSLEWRDVPPSSEVVYGEVFEFVRKRFWCSMPPSVRELHLMQAESVWMVAKALDALLSAKDSAESGRITDWQYQINRQYHVWYKSRAKQMPPHLKGGNILLNTLGDSNSGLLLKWDKWKLGQQSLSSTEAKWTAIYCAFLLDTLNEWWDTLSASKPPDFVAWWRNLLDSKRPDPTVSILSYKRQKERGQSLEHADKDNRILAKDYFAFWTELQAIMEKGNRHAIAGSGGKYASALHAIVRAPFACRLHSESEAIDRIIPPLREAARAFDAEYCDWMTARCEKADIKGMDFTQRDPFPKGLPYPLEDWIQPGLGVIARVYTKGSTIRGPNEEIYRKHFAPETMHGLYCFAAFLLDEICKTQPDVAGQPIRGGFSHSPNYRTVSKDGAEFNLTPSQAAVIRELDIAGDNSLSLAELQGSAHFESPRLHQDVFKTNKAAFEALISKTAKGMYALKR